MLEAQYKVENLTDTNNKYTFNDRYLVCMRKRKMKKNTEMNKYC